MLPACHANSARFAAAQNRIGQSPSSNQTQHNVVLDLTGHLVIQRVQGDPSCLGLLIQYYSKWWGFTKRNNVLLYRAINGTNMQIYWFKMEILYNVDNSNVTFSAVVRRRPRELVDGRKRSSALRPPSAKSIEEASSSLTLYYYQLILISNC